MITMKTRQNKTYIRESITRQTWNNDFDSEVTVLADCRDERNSLVELPDRAWPSVEEQHWYHLHSCWYLRIKKRVDSSLVLQILFHIRLPVARKRSGEMEQYQPIGLHKIPTPLGQWTVCQAALGFSPTLGDVFKHGRVIHQNQTQIILLTRKNWTIIWRRRTSLKKAKTYFKPKDIQIDTKINQL